MTAARAFVLLAAASFQLTGQNSDALFDPVISKVHRQWRLPVRVPTELPDLGDVKQRVYAALGNSTRRGYEIILGFTPDCNGGTACRIGTVSGSTSSRKLRGKPVKLADGVTGYFLDAKCGANCSDSTITWKQVGAVYSMGIKAGRLPELTKMANSAILNKPR
ncbi:MAG: hypothetical protein M3Z85_08230 [Acidobacteriota bacterium]|nr:hypothetical protein [Acidobacteriota bacterium]